MKIKTVKQGLKMHNCPASNHKCTLEMGPMNQDTLSADFVDCLHWLYEFFHWTPPRHALGIYLWASPCQKYSHFFEYSQSHLGDRVLSAVTTLISDGQQQTLEKVLSILLVGRPRYSVFSYHLQNRLFHICLPENRLYLLLPHPYHLDY